MLPAMVCAVLSENSTLFCAGVKVQLLIQLPFTSRVFEIPLNDRESPVSMVMFSVAAFPVAIMGENGVKLEAGMKYIGRSCVNREAGVVGTPTGSPRLGNPCKSWCRQYGCCLIFVVGVYRPLYCV